MACRSAAWGSTCCVSTTAADRRHPPAARPRRAGGARLSPGRGGGVRIGSARARSATPPAVARAIVDAALKPGDTLVFDPAVGGGVFLLAATRHLAEQGESLTRIVQQCLHGVDVDPLAVAVTHAALAILSGGTAGPGENVRVARCPRHPAGAVRHGRRQSTLPESAGHGHGSASRPGAGAAAAVRGRVPRLRGLVEPLPPAGARPGPRRWPGGDDPARVVPRRPRRGPAWQHVAVGLISCGPGGV